MTASDEIEFYFDLVCPFAYIASNVVDSLAESAGRRVIWKCVALGGVYNLSDAPQGKKSASSIMSPSKRKWFGRDLLIQASRRGVELAFPKDWPTLTLKPMRVCNPSTLTLNAHSLFFA